MHAGLFLWLVASGSAGTAPAFASRHTGHPLHTTMTEVQWDATDGRVTIILRLFTEDLATAVGRFSGRPIPGGPEALVPDSLALAYLRATISLVDRGGSSVRLAWAGARRQGDVSFITLRGTMPAGLSGGRLSNAVHCELFPDQVNIVKARSGDRNDSFLFVGGDGPRTLR